MMTRRMRVRGILFSILAVMTMPLLGQDACLPPGEKSFHAYIAAVTAAHTCKEAQHVFHQCVWGSSADLEPGAIVVKKCEASFIRRLTPRAKERYKLEMRLCAEEYASQEGTMSLSEGAICRVDVAASFASHLSRYDQPLPRASFDCSKAVSALEMTICSDAELGRLDIILGRSYGVLIKSFSAIDRALIRGNESTWLATIPQRCGLPNASKSKQAILCLRDQFQKRIGSLDACGASMDMGECGHQLGISAKTE
ncbi:MAG: hypothetical protein JSS87_06210 [Acidobacteria bacterium]|nr:hypothetical protein [Acidobacteriota bacterium]